MKPLLMPRRDAHKSSTGAADLSKHLEKGPKPCSCLIFIFPRVPVVLKARLRAGSSPGTATSQTAPSSRGQDGSCCPSVVHGLEELRSHEPALPSYSLASDLSLLCIQSGAFLPNGPSL